MCLKGVNREQTCPGASQPQMCLFLPFLIALFPYFAWRSPTLSFLLSLIGLSLSHFSLFISSHFCQYLATRFHSAKVTVTSSLVRKPLPHCLRERIRLIPSQQMLKTQWTTLYACLNRCLLAHMWVCFISVTLNTEPFQRRTWLKYMFTTERAVLLLDRRARVCVCLRLRPPGN